MFQLTSIQSKTILTAEYVAANWTLLELFLQAKFG